MNERLDEIDRRIIYHLMSDARNVSAPAIAEEVHVSAGTIRNRIAQLEEAGVITGYHAAVDFERAGNHLTNLFICRAPVPERERVAAAALQIPGVVNVRELMTGGANVHVVAVGRDMDDMNRIARAIAELDLEIEDEELVQAEYSRSYQPFGPEDDTHASTFTDVVSLAGDADVVEVTVDEDAPVVGLTLTEAGEQETLPEDVLVIAIERDGEVLTPRGDTTVEAGDLVTVLSRNGTAADALGVFRGHDAE
ncbi:TrkA C-terminal domain-containing protein [Haloarchaeobius baliensis]|uniref:Lrp/AsnC family transcriptional regulator n=1 Tax=Haloarchaeobius baliensis TaxID=1670458 RepID=UPI003F8805D3